MLCRSARCGADLCGRPSRQAPAGLRRRSSGSSSSSSGGRSSSRGSRRPSVAAQAALEPTVAAAVTQQAAAFALVLAGEAAFSRSNVPESDKGRPQVTPVAAGVGTTLAAALLVGQGGGGIVPTLGLVVGLAASGAMLYYNARRAADLTYTDGDWPGPKAWPAGMALVSFFAVCVFAQALVSDVTTSVV